MYHVRRTGRQQRKAKPRKMFADGSHPYRHKIDFLAIAAASHLT
jgi:hypothetical protein